MLIKHSNDAKTIREAVNDGFCPVECSIGGESIVDSLQMDHHGTLSHLEGVAVRAYRDHFGARRADQRFVVTGAADADACFAIAALAGLLPHRSREIEITGKPWLEGMDADILPFAELVNRVDVNPIGARLTESEDGRRLLLWNQTSSHAQDALAFYGGVDRWRWALSAPTIMLHVAAAAERSRVEDVAKQTKVTPITSIVTVVESPLWGFDVWYETSPVVVALAPGGNVTIGCVNAEKAIELFGPGGLKAVFPLLTPAGWGGREAIGGSPRGRKMTHQDAIDAARTVAHCVR